MTDSYCIPGFDAPVIAEPDVCVIGGGAAGLAAAVAASRVGLRVLLVERYGFCGGATVAGLSGSICGLYSSSDQPRQIVFGFAAEFRDRMAKRDGTGDPIPFGLTRLVPHDSFAWKETADSLLRENHIQTLYHTQFLKAFSVGDNIEALLLIAKQGPVVVRPRTVVDASGDADVIHSLHMETSLGKNGTVQTPSMIFRMGNVDIGQFSSIDPAEIDCRVTEAHKSGAFDLPRHHVYLFPTPNRREVLCNMTRIVCPDGTAPVGITSEALTYAEMEGRRQARSYASFLRACIPGFSEAYLSETGAQVGIRQTRSICGKATLKNDDVLCARKVPGASTYSAWPIELHGANGVSLRYLKDDTYDIPFEAQVPLAISNVLVAGRCLSAEHEALASARVTAQCFGMGYAAGAATGLIVREQLSAQSLTGVQVQDWMHAHRIKTAGEP